MAWFEDLAPCTYFSPEISGLKAVGWLDQDHPYSRGDVSLPFIDRLVELLLDPWQPVHYCGFHPCPFCRFRFSTVPATPTFSWKNTPIHMGVRNLFVPGDGFIFVAPSLILHYMDAHEYAPPSEFMDAVIACPAMKSMDYLKTLRKNAPARLLNFGKGKTE